jgi:hypothetical protein
MRIETIMVYTSPYLCPCYTSLMEILHVHVLGLLCTPARTSPATRRCSLSTLFAGRNHAVSLICVGFRIFEMWNSSMWVNLSVVYNSSPVLSVTEAVYETHDGIYFIFRSPTLWPPHRTAMPLCTYKQDLGSADVKLDKGVATKHLF